MSGKLSRIIREYILGLSILTIIIGAVVSIFGLLGTFMQDIVNDLLDMSSDVLMWSPYVLVIGLILLIAGLWYLYDFFRNKKLLLEDIQTNKRSEFCKNHASLKKAAKHLPSKYQEMLKQKEKELNIR